MLLVDPIAQWVACLIGPDFLLDESNKVWLLEVNQNPSIDLSFPLDIAIKVVSNLPLFSFLSFFWTDALDMIRVCLVSYFFVLSCLSLPFFHQAHDLFHGGHPP